MATMYDIRTASTLSSQLAGLLSFHNEHRLLLPRLFTIGLTKINGGVIDFRWWIWLGNSLLLVILVVFYRVFILYRKPFLYFLPVILFLFQPLWIELTYWGMASLQNIGVLALSASTLYLVSSDKKSLKRIVTVFVLTCATILTGANGQLLLVSVAFVLLVRGQYKQTIGWILASVISIKLYWIGFSVEINSGSKALILSSLLDKSISFLGLMGAFIESQRYGFLTVGTGIVFLSLFAYLVFQKLKDLVYSSSQLLSRNELFVLAFSSFLLLTMGTIGIHRHYEDVLHVGRYKIYSVLLLICLYLLSLNYLHWTNRMIQVLITLCLVFNGVSYVRSWPAISVHQAYLRNQLNNWILNREVEAPNSFMRAYYEQRWTNTYREGFYKIPTLP